jgi:hypothetical protein
LICILMEKVVWVIITSFFIMAITCLLHALRWYYVDTVTYKQQPSHPQIYSITDWLERIGVSFKINDCLLETSAGYFYLNYLIKVRLSVQYIPDFIILKIYLSQSKKGMLVSSDNRH